MVRRRNPWFDAGPADPSHSPEAKQPLSVSDSSQRQPGQNTALSRSYVRFSDEHLGTQTGSHGANRLEISRSRTQARREGTVTDYAKSNQLSVAPFVDDYPNTLIDKLLRLRLSDLMI